MKHYADDKRTEVELLDSLYAETYRLGAALIKGIKAEKTDTAQYKHYEKQHDLLTALIETYRKGY